MRLVQRGRVEAMQGFLQGDVDDSAWLMSGWVAACTVIRIAGDAHVPVCKSCVSLILKLVIMLSPL